MTKKFSEKLISFLDSGTQCLLLGDSDHGGKSLKSLAAAVDERKLKLSAYNVLILVEGARENETRSDDYLAVKLLKEKGAKIAGCENDESLSAQTKIDELLEPPDDAVSFNGAYCSDLFGQRILEANLSWEIQIQRYCRWGRMKVILCCGTSHLPFYAEGDHVDKGLIERLKETISVCGYAVEESRSDDNLYEPEPHTNAFGKIEAIGQHANLRKFEMSSTRSRYRCTFSVLYNAFRCDRRRSA
jgi:hypothetical protein